MLTSYLTNHKIRVALLLFAAATLASFGLLYNILQRGIASASEDDIHTINYGINSLYTHQVPEARVGESTRWLARLTYPFGLYYMNSNMGGEHYLTGWEYSGGYYVRKHFQSQADIAGDPNLQDLEFAMKFALGSIVILSFLVASWMISTHYGYLAGLAYYTLSMGSSLVNDMLSVFYTETTMVIMFNLLLIIAFIPKISSLRLYLWLAFILAFAISAKITGVIFLIPTLVILKSRQGETWVKGLRIEAFILLVPAFVWLINYYIVDNMIALDQTLANVYHYKTGHLVTEPSGKYQVVQMIKQIPIWISVFPIAFGFILLSKVQSKNIVIAVGITACVIIIASFGVSVFVVRNLTTPVILIIFVTSIAFSYAVNRFQFPNNKLIAAAALLLVFAVAWIRLYDPITEKSLSSFASNYKTIGLIDVSNEYFPGGTVLNSMPDQFTLQGHVNDFTDPLLPFECIVIKRIGNNKHLTNYLLPMNFRLITRIGNYFVFEQKKKEIADVNRENEHFANIRTLEKYTPLYDGEYKIYKIDTDLVFYKSNCTEEMLSNRFFLHLYPINLSSLSGESATIGFANADFDFPASALYNGEAYLKIALPSYPIDHIETGQFNDSGRLWETAIKF